MVFVFFSAISSFADFFIYLAHHSIGIIDCTSVFFICLGQQVDLYAEIIEGCVQLDSIFYVLEVKLYVVYDLNLLYECLHIVG